MNGIAFFDKNSTWNAEGGVSGTIKLHQCSPHHFTQFSLDLRVDETNSLHALHIHEYGNLSQGCMGSGGHYNPFGRNHGTCCLPERGRHVGDLINNVKSDSEGRIKINFSDDLVNVDGFRKEKKFRMNDEMKGKKEKKKRKGRRRGGRGEKKRRKEEKEEKKKGGGGGRPKRISRNIQ